MDPIAHTLAGASLAQTKLGKTTALATPTLMIGANLPDIDAVVTIFGSDVALYLRRGLTHGVAAMVILPLLLSAAIIAFDRRLRRRKYPDKSPVNPKAIVALSYLGVWSHPLLDWLNTYGVRLLMPFDGRWFYGDTLFIIDPWMWLLLAASVVFAHTQTRLSQSSWAILGAAATALILLVDMVPLAAKIAWALGLIIIVTLRRRGISTTQNQGVATFCIALFCIYIAAMMAGNQLAKTKALHTLDDGAVAADLMTGPLPANPMARDVLVVTESEYRALRIRLMGQPQVEMLYDPVPIEAPGPLVRQALNHPDIKGFVNWMRFPTYEVRPLDSGHRVIIRDLRYVRPDDEPGQAIGIATVDLPAD